MSEPANIHISSAVVSVLPRHQAEVVRLLSSVPGIEVHHQAPSKIVIVLEAPESGLIGRRLAQIATMDGVLSANMVFERAISEDGE